jgi:hypothetical protein
MMEYWNVGIFSSILITQYSKLKFSIDIQTSFDMMGQIIWLRMNLPAASHWVSLKVKLILSQQAAGN